MELEEMQATWSHMSQQLEAQKKLTDEIILKMTKERYKNHWNKLIIPDKIFGLIGIILVIAVISNFNKLDTLALQTSGVISILILTLLTFFSFKTLRDLQHIDIARLSYKDVMTTYAKKKQRFIKFQKVNMWGSFVFMLVSVPVTLKFLKDENIFESSNPRLIIAFPICCLLFYVLVLYLKRCNKNMLKNSEKILEDIKE